MKVIKKILVIFLVIVELCLVYLMYKSSNNKKILDNTEIIEKKEKIAIMVQDEEGKYNKFSGSTFPSEGYVLNVDESECLDIEGNKIENVISRSNGSVTLTNKYTSYCTLYFDLAKHITDLSGNNNYGISYAASWGNDGITTSDEKTAGFINCGLANHNFEDSITYVVRIKINSIRWGHIISNHEGAGIALLVGNNILHLSVNSASDHKYYDIQTTLNGLLNEFITIIGVYGNDGMSIFVNGDKKVSDTSHGNISVSSVPIFIGDNPAGSYVAEANSLLATYSDVLIFDTALTDEEIKEYFSGEIEKDKVINNYVNNNQDKKLLLYYRFIN